MMGNGSMDQAVVVLVNDAIFAYFDHTKQTFILRPSASAGFSVLEKRSSTFCLSEVFKGFLRQAKYLESFKDDTQSSKPLLGDHNLQFVKVSSTHSGFALYNQIPLFSNSTSFCRSVH